MKCPSFSVVMGFSRTWEIL